ncbi:MAG: hypothetical protein GY725_20140, partial [bacterium]|nr:hypothetical protein [bacterium]
PGALATATVASLEALARLTYQYVRPEDDASHDGHHTQDTRDHAERARDVIFKALIDRPGAHAQHAMRALSAAETCKARSIHFRQLTHGKAEHDAELPIWAPTEVLHFERCLIAPAKTGEALLRVVLAVLSDIQNSFRRRDATSRSLVVRAENEQEIQEWLTEQMEHRSEGRYHAHREAQVADGDKPDIIISSTAASVEVAIEIKHGGMPWTVRQLENALAKQLAVKYLKPIERRWGVLVVTHHGRFRAGKEGVRTRTWRDPGTRTILTFHDLIRRLEKLATKVVKNKFGHVEVRTFGIDASAH